MNYIYDIALNFHDNYYDFFEWNKQDNIINIHKIPVFRLNDNDYINFKTNKIKCNLAFLNEIKDQTIVYLGLKNKYMCIITNCKEAFAISLNNYGIITKRSSLILDEEDEVLELSEYLDNKTIDYEIINKLKINNFICRNELENKKKLVDKINELYNQNNLLVLKYIYYDYYEKEENNILKIKDTLLKDIFNNWNEKQYKLFHLIQMIKTK